MKETARANANIALVKYWGNRDKKLILPYNSSISMTLDKLFTTTTVEFSEKYRKNELWMNGQKILGIEAERAFGLVDLVRKKAKLSSKAKIASNNSFPTSAGLASSASGFAALVLSASKAAGLDLSQRELSMLARMGSGSAARSIHGGFVEWKKGSKSDGSDCYGEQIAKKEHWPGLRMLVAIVSTKKKKVGSRAGMDLTVKTSPMYDSWLATIDNDLKDMKEGILKRDFKKAALTAQLNCLKMHAAMITTKPPIIYWQPETIELMNSVLSWQDEGIDCAFTIDGGPQLKLICLRKDSKKLMGRLSTTPAAKKVIECKCGGQAKIIKEDLF